MFDIQSFIYTAQKEAQKALHRYLAQTSGRTLLHLLTEQVDKGLDSPSHKMSQSVLSARFTKQDASPCYIPHLSNIVTKIQLPPIFLVGMPGSGKTTIGKLIADRLHRDFFDCDHLIEQKSGKTIPEIFRECGEPTFRNLETSVLRSLTQQHNAIIATGGGAVVRVENRKMLQNFPVLYLQAELQALLNQTHANADRPLLNVDRKQTLQTLLEQRIPLYLEVANETIATTKVQPADNAILIARWILRHEQK